MVKNDSNETAKSPRLSETVKRKAIQFLQHINCKGKKEVIGNL